MSNHLRLHRIAFIEGEAVECPEGTFGRLIFPNGESFFTCENPWKNNEPFVSCIPNGSYYMEQRHSPVVRRTSGGEFQEGWEVTDVRDRSYIMVHPGNWPHDVEGCIAVGKRLGIAQDKKGQWSLAVLDSRAAFREIMELMDEYNTWTIDIDSHFIEVF